MTDERKFAFLIKKRSAGKGLEYHLLEHIIIARLKGKQFRIAGFSSEDYMFFWGVGDVKKQDILLEIESICPTQSEVNHEFALVKREFRERKASILDLIWEGTFYEDHPIGGIDKLPEIETISLLKKNIQAGNIFFHSCKSPYKPDKRNLRSRELRFASAFTAKKTIVFDGQSNTVLFFKGIPDLFYLAGKILQLYNPSNYIYLSDKAKQNALVFDEQLKFPEYSQLGELLNTAKGQLHQEIDELKQDYFSLILTRLESAAHYGIPWEARVKKVLQISKSQINKAFLRIRQ